MTGEGRGGYPKGIARKRAIIQEAAKLFADRGYSAGSTRELAARVGMTQSGMLHHFANKEELLTAVLNLRDEGLRDALLAADARDVGQMVSVTARLDESEPGLTKLFSVLSAESTSAEHPAHVYFAERYQRVFGQLVDSFRDAMARGEVDDSLDPEGLSRLIIAVLDGVLLQPAYLDSTVPSDVTDLLWALITNFRPETVPTPAAGQERAQT